MSTSVPETSTARDPSLGRDILAYLRYQLRGRRGIILAAVAIGVPALWIGWPWLVVAGIAPLLISFAPCAIMCALGLCMMGKSCKSEAAVTPAAAPEALPLQQAAIGPDLSTSSGTSCDSLAEGEVPSRRL
jgi:hypothetical protein